MTSRIQDNQIKAFIYVAIFAALALKILFLQPSIEETERRTTEPEFGLPVDHDFTSK